MKLIRAYFPLFLTASLIIALDQWTKWLVRENIPFGGQWLPDGLTWLMPYARLVHWYNTGVAFGLFQGYGWVSGALALVVVGLIIYYYPRPEASEWWMRLALGMQAAGALGNLIDRLTLDGKVTDFISVGTFPVFNIADASITLGVGVLLLGVYLKERAEQKQARAESDSLEGGPEREAIVDAGVAQGE
ncbi:MAG: signal peptidase II [Anaerolineales bacterium]